MPDFPVECYVILKRCMIASFFDSKQRNVFMGLKKTKNLYDNNKEV
ncbi:hypothetical protein DEHRE_09215 [Dehalobacter restrictus DSM 9455]|jgi:hypothetical protein|uniref:Uncharacterized protein n=1 Tax=Dehalobacter restrictus (strain DSM 9455 / PER-K23) TaxID=871738 RepID=A0ABN4BVF4_DEHRP|nr:hypothetical protein DEHRE_09215 [Dehalobacter restrictus DSM 9455]